MEENLGLTTQCAGGLSLVAASRASTLLRFATVVFGHVALSLSQKGLTFVLLKLTTKQIWRYSTNALLVIICLILLVPSWRVSFQGWWAGLWLSDAKFEQGTITTIEPEVRNWAMWNMDSDLKMFQEFQGKPLLLSFWATWCGPCRTELGELKELKEEMNSEIQIVAVSTEPLKVIEESGLAEDYDFLHFSQDSPKQLEVTSFPTLYVFDSELNIVHKSVGAANLNTEENINFLKQL